MQLLDEWLKRFPTWAYVLVVAGITFLGVFALGAAGQWLFFRHLDLSTLVGTAVGCTLGTTIMASWYRVNQRTR